MGEIATYLFTKCLKKLCLHRDQLKAAPYWLFSAQNRQIWHFLGKYQSKLTINNHKLCQSAFNRQFTQFTLLLRCQKLKDCKFLEYYAKLFNIAVSDKNLVKLRYQRPFLFDSHLVFWQISLTQGHWRRTKTTKLLHNFQFILCQNQYFLICCILKEVKGSFKILNV